MNKLLHTRTFNWMTAVSLFLAAVPVVLIFSGCESGEPPREAPAPPEQTTEQADVPSIPAGSLSEEMLGQTVNVTGEVLQQCPSSGCWLKVTTGEGETFVNLLPSPVRLTESRVGQQTRVTGEVVRRGSDLAIDARQIEFDPSPRTSPEEKD